MGVGPCKSRALNMLRLVVVSLAVASCQAMHGKQVIKNQIQNWNDDVACWGRSNALKFRMNMYQAMEQCGDYGMAMNMLRPTSPFQPLQQAASTLPATNPFTTLPGQVQNPWTNVPAPINNRLNPFAGLVNRGILASLNAGRSKREVANGALEEEELEKFLEDFDDFKQDIGTKMGNLTCVLTKMKMLDSTLQVNLEYLTNQRWNEFDVSSSLAGQDPLWRKKMVEGYMDAYSIASNWPQQSLDRNPLTKIFGRHMIFFHIAMKMEKKNCYKAQMYDWLQTLYGNSDNFNWSQVGLPADKYDRAAVAVMVMQQAETKEEMFVKQFFNNNEAMM